MHTTHPDNSIVYSRLLHTIRHRKYHSVPVYPYNFLHLLELQSLEATLLRYW